MPARLVTPGIGRRDEARTRRTPRRWKYREVPRVGCRELGGDCDYVAEGQTPEEVKRELLAHVEHAHAERVARMSRDERDALDVRIDQVLRRS